MAESSSAALSHHRPLSLIPGGEERRAAKRVGGKVEKAVAYGLARRGVAAAAEEARREERVGYNHKVLAAEAEPAGCSNATRLKHKEYYVKHTFPC